MLALACLGNGPSKTAPESSDYARQAFDQRLADIGYRLAAAAVPFCNGGVASLGISVQDLSQYDTAAQPQARVALGLGDDPQILAAAAGSAAADAKVQAGDAILTIDGVAPPPPGGTSSFARTEQVLDMLDAAAARGSVTLALRRGAHRFISVLTPRPACASRFQTDPSPGVNAHADGRYISVNIGTMAFARDDDELAAIAAHELAHNILGHHAILAAAGILPDRPSRLSEPQRRLIRQTEQEADRLSVHLLSAAGYKPEAAIAFWTRYAREHRGPSPRLRSEHGSPQSRIETLEEEIANRGD